MTSTSFSVPDSLSRTTGTRGAHRPTPVLSTVHQSIRFIRILLCIIQLMTRSEPGGFHGRSRCVQFNGRFVLSLHLRKVWWKNTTLLGWWLGRRLGGIITCPCRISCIRYVGSIRGTLFPHSPAVKEGNEAKPADGYHSHRNSYSYACLRARAETRACLCRGRGSGSRDTTGPSRCGRGGHLSHKFCYVDGTSCVGSGCRFNGRGGEFGGGGHVKGFVDSKLGTVGILGRIV